MRTFAVVAGTCLTATTIAPFSFVRHAATAAAPSAVRRPPSPPSVAAVIVVGVAVRSPAEDRPSMIMTGEGQPSILIEGAAVDDDGGGGVGWGGNNIGECLR